MYTLFSEAFNIILKRRNNTKKIDRKFLHDFINTTLLRNKTRRRTLLIHNFRPTKKIKRYLEKKERKGWHSAQ